MLQMLFCMATKPSQLHWSLNSSLKLSSIGGVSVAHGLSFAEILLLSSSEPIFMNPIIEQFQKSCYQCSILHGDQTKPSQLQWSLNSGLRLSSSGGVSVARGLSLSLTLWAEFLIFGQKIRCLISFQSSKHLHNMAINVNCCCLKCLKQVLFQHFMCLNFH